MNIVDKLKRLNDIELKIAYQLAHKKDIYNEQLMDLLQVKSSFSRDQLEEIIKTCEEIAAERQFVF